MGETEEITVLEINILVAKGINKDSELGSVQGTQGMTTEWIFATMVAGFLDFKMIYFHILGPIMCSIYFLCIIYILMF